MGKRSLDLGMFALLCVAIPFYLYFPFSPEAFSHSTFDALGDELLGLWIFHRWSENLFTNPGVLYDGGVFYPSNLSLAFAETMVIPSLIYRAFYWLVNQPLVAYHFTVTLLMALNAGGFYWAAKHFFSRTASVLGAMIFTFSMVRLTDFNHVQLVPQVMFPLVAAWLYRFETTRDNRYLALAGVATAAQMYFSIHFGIMLILTVVPYFALRVWKDRKDKSLWKNSFLFFFGVAGLVLPLFIPYYIVSKEYGIVRTLGQSRPLSASLFSYISPPRGGIYDFVLNIIPIEKLPFAHVHLFFGVIVLALVYLGWKDARKTNSQNRKFWFLVTIVTLAFLFSLTFGPSGLLYSVVYYLFPLMKGLRVPGRFGLPMLLVIAGLAMVGLQVLLARFPQKNTKRIVGALIVLLFLAENRIHYKLVKIPVEIQGTAHYLETMQDKAPVVHFPLTAQYIRYQGDKGNAFDNREVVRMYYGLWHKHPLLNGHSGFDPDAYLQLNQAERDLGPSVALLEHARKMGAGYAVIEKNIEDSDLKEKWMKLLGTRTIIYEDDHAAIIGL